MSKAFLVVDAHTKFEVSSFSRLKDIGASILKMWASSTTLYSTLSGSTRAHNPRFSSCTYHYGYRPACDFWFRSASGELHRGFFDFAKIRYTVWSRDSQWAYTTDIDRKEVKGQGHGVKTNYY